MHHRSAPFVQQEGSFHARALSNASGPSPLQWSRLQKVGRKLPRRHFDVVLGHSLKDLELDRLVRVEAEDRRDIAAAIAVVWRGPNSDEVLIREHKLEALLNELMRARDQLKAIDVRKLARHFAAKEPSGPPRTHRPRLNVLGIRPHQI